MRRPDPYRTRARELCIAAGIEPDSRIGEGRGQPAWCTFRDAARAEHIAAEQAAVAADLAVAPQSTKFHNSPLKVFGEHEESTIAQMRNCMSIGNAVAGVICADGHLGYAQPVGGVIAYEGQISISGVGFDIGCGNMAVRLDTPFADIQPVSGKSSRTCTKSFRSALAETTMSGWSTNCSMIPTRGAKPTTRIIGKRPSTSLVQSAPATTTLT